MGNTSVRTFQGGQKLTVWRLPHFSLSLRRLQSTAVSNPDAHASTDETNDDSMQCSTHCGEDVVYHENEIRSDFSSQRLTNAFGGDSISKSKMKMK